MTTTHRLPSPLRSPRFPRCLTGAIPLLAGAGIVQGQSYVSLPSFDSNVSALTISGNTLYLGGSFTSVNGASTRNGLAAIDLSNGSLTSWNPGANGAVNAMSLSPDGNTLYVGGNFTTIGGGGTGSTARNYLAALSTSSGAVTSWDPNPNQRVSYLTVSPGGGTMGNVYTIGDFTSLEGGGTARPLGIAGIQPDGTVTAFNPDNSVGGGGFPSHIANSSRGMAVSGDGNTLYWINQNQFTFNAVGGGTADRRGIVGFQTSDGLVTSFNPAATQSGFGGNSFAVLTVGNDLYISGNWDTIAGIGRDRIAKFVNETLDTNFNTTPAGSGGPGGMSNGPGRRMAMQNGVLYVIGDFNSYQGDTSRSGLVAIDPVTGAKIESWNPNTATGGVGHDSNAQGGFAVNATGVYFGDANMTSFLGNDVTGRNVAGLTTAVPEPEEYAVLTAIALGGLVFHRRRRIARATAHPAARS